MATRAAPPSRGDVFGFTLIEVIIAVAILGLALTVILSAQVGLFATGTYGQHVSEALGLARCRMSELEVQLVQFGYPEVDSLEQGPCCNDEARPDYRCGWRIERIELPMPGAVASTSPSGGPAPTSPYGAGGMGPLDPTAVAVGMPTATSTTGINAPPIDASSLSASGVNLGALGAISGSGAGALTGSGSGIGGLSTALAAGATSGTDGLAPLVMGLVYPSLKPMLEASIRKLTVTVMWRDGLTQREIEIVQWVTNPNKGGLLASPIGSDSAGLGGLGLPGAATPAAGATRPAVPGLGR